MMHELETPVSQKLYLRCLAGAMPSKQHWPEGNAQHQAAYGCARGLHQPILTYRQAGHLPGNCMGHKANGTIYFLGPIYSRYTKASWANRVRCHSLPAAASERRLLERRLAFKILEQENSCVTLSEQVFGNQSIAGQNVQAIKHCASATCIMTRPLVTMLLVLSSYFQYFRLYSEALSQVQRPLWYRCQQF